MSAVKKRTSNATTRVASGIVTLSSSLRSTNLERDVQAETLAHLYVGNRAQEILTRITAALSDRSRTRAWSLTGPYGSGKSTLALLLDALLNVDPQRRAEALQYVKATNPLLAEQLDGSRNAVAPSGCLAAVATARREPLATTLGRGLASAVSRYWPGRRIPRPIAAIVAPLREPVITSSQILDAVEALCGYAPLLLVIDEFGKNLEYLAGGGAPDNSSDDLFLLQELAELGAGTNGLPLYMLTLQHLSFVDYAARASEAQRREWAKVQGRFEDITMTPDVGDALQLIGRSLDQSGVPVADRDLIKAHASASKEAWIAHGLDCLIAGDTALFAALYPLHPLAAVAAPLLAAQVGQHDRSLTGFLASDEPHTVHRFLNAEAGHEDAPRTVRLAQLYDYFLGSGRTTVLASANASRWIEIETRIAEANGLSAQDAEVLKTVGLLNLVDSAGALRASPDLIQFALSDPVDNGTSATQQKRLKRRVNDLVKRGFLVYREFSDEYRIWQGSDSNLQALIDAARANVADADVVELLGKHLPSAVVAGHHSQRTGMLRHFVTATSAPTDQRISAPAVSSGADGLLLFHFGDRLTTPTITTKLPVAIGTTDKVQQILAVGREVLALTELAKDATLDAVARREAVERLGQATAELATELSDAFAPGRRGTCWHLRMPAPNDDGYQYELLQARSMASVVSKACDKWYKHSPEIRNEMLGRNQLTSQGAKARRELLTRMLTHAHDEHLGIGGFGPERAMYSGVLEYLDLHRCTDGTAGHYGLVSPPADSSLAEAWRSLEALLATADEPTSVDKVVEHLLAPPYGIKMGVAPLVLLAALILHREDVAIFEDGTYQPRLTTDLMERLVKAPHHFTLKAVGTAKGQRKIVLDQLLAYFELEHSPARSNNRNPGLLSAAQVLLDHARNLSAYAKRTKRVSEKAVAVRAALHSSREPDGLVFIDLPRALGLKPIAPSGRRNQVEANAYVEQLTATLHELATIDTALRAEVVKKIAQAFRLPNDLPNLRRDLTARARGFAEALLEPRLKGLIALALNEHLTDDEWLEPVVVRIVGTPLNDWDDKTAEAFPRRAQELARSLDRISHLYQAAQLEADAQPFTAELVTLTSPDGREERTMVYTPQDVVEAAESLAAASLADAEKQLGPDGARILLATLAKKLLGSENLSVLDNTEATEPKEALT